ncbi:ankyrin repeat domain-containing protein [Flavobacterium cerinum]|uniref:Ankyrin repeat domain-containing protein n=1 Tax=Flavobacterium cerinum TaxID=2502784 RepID=A0ABY5IUH9_9FLAO|nr:ankyrin repeat domain-containing protein [Flavobacterium cerinum]UUC46482.1 ankyrin repeat domain-containing protein [Flavobacterium cerinum]
MKLSITQSFKDIIEEDLLDLEKNIHFELPKEYKDFLLKYNGGRPNPNVFRTKKGEYETDIQFFFGITTGIYDILDNFHRLDDLDGKYIGIAIDSGGSLILMNLDSSEIYYYDTDIAELFLISESFEAFLKGLYNVTLEEDDFDRAVNKQDVSFFRDLIQSGKKIDEIVNKYDQPLLIAASLRNKLSLVKFCLDNNAKKDLALISAAGNGHLEVVKYLIEKGANIEERDPLQNNDTPLIQAAFNGSLDIVKLLINRGADIYAEDIHENNALNKAYWSDNQELIDYLENEVYN